MPKLYDKNVGSQVLGSMYGYPEYSVRFQAGENSTQMAEVHACDILADCEDIPDVDLIEMLKKTYSVRINAITLSLTIRVFKRMWSGRYVEILLPADPKESGEDEHMDDTLFFTTKDGTQASASLADWFTFAIRDGELVICEADFVGEQDEYVVIPSFIDEKTASIEFELDGKKYTDIGDYGCANFKEFSESLQLETVPENVTGVKAYITDEAIPM